MLYSINFSSKIGSIWDQDLDLIPAYKKSMLHLDLNNLRLMTCGG